MRSLVLEDDYVSSALLKAILSPFGDVDIADNGREGLDLFEKALNEENPYDLVCLDIMVPNMDGQEVLIEIRHLEEVKDIYGHDAVKIIMTTALGDFENVRQAFREQCEDYLVKPIDKDKLLKKIKDMGLI
ncbi:MAG: PleD family two-component system response regulator [Halanaerobiales bacterium]